MTLLAVGALLRYSARRSGRSVPARVAGAADGPGPNPLLQNHILMAVHPPLLYLGYVGMSVPFAFAVGAMLSGEAASNDWIRLTRRWTLASWGFLSARSSPACGGRTRCSAGAATGRGIRWRTRRSCPGSQRPRSCTRRWCRSGAACSGCGPQLVVGDVRADDPRHVPDALAESSRRCTRSRTGTIGYYFLAFIAHRADRRRWCSSPATPIDCGRRATSIGARRARRCSCCNNLFLTAFMLHGARRHALPARRRSGARREGQRGRSVLQPHGAADDRRRCSSSWAWDPRCRGRAATRDELRDKLVPPGVGGRCCCGDRAGRRRPRSTRFSLRVRRLFGGGEPARVLDRHARAASLRTARRGLTALAAAGRGQSPPLRRLHRAHRRLLRRAWHRDVLDVAHRARSDAQGRADVGDCRPHDSTCEKCGVAMRSSAQSSARRSMCSTAIACAERCSRA